MPDKVLKVVISEADKGIRLDRWFRRHYPSLPHAKLQQLLRKGAIKLNAARAQASQRIEEGQVLLIPPFSAQKIERRTFPLSQKQISELQERIIYKNDDLLLFNKPAGLAVQGGTNITLNLDVMLDALKFEKTERPRLVHRLDKETSGLLLLARSTAVAAELASYFRERTIEKTYWALLDGVPAEPQGVIQSEIDSRFAETAYRLLGVAQEIAWVEFHPKTGRKHQLRIHAAHQLGCPIVGDKVYGGAGGRAASSASGRGRHGLQLHARALRLPAVAHNEGQMFTAPLPPAMEESFAKLGFFIS